MLQPGPSEHTSRVPLLAGMLYLLVPFCIFAIGWMQWYVALPLLAAAGFSAVRAYRDMPRIWCPVLNRQTVGKALAAVVIIGILTWISGVGGRVYQTVDHAYRNEIFRILVDFPWPVVRGESALLYYFGFWLPAALIGKLFGLTAGFLFQMVWTALGLFILFTLLCAWRKKLVLWPFMVFLFFSGLDVFCEGYILSRIDFSRIPFKFTYLLDLDRWSPFSMYPSLLTNLFWSFQQAVPVYVLLLLLVLQPDCRNYAYLSALCLLCGTLPVVGLIPAALAMAASRPAADEPIDRRWLTGKTEWEKTLRDILSPQNLLGGVSIAAVLWLFFSANRAGGHTAIQGFDLLYVECWLVAVIFEFGVYMLLVAKQHRENVLLPILFLCLASAPWIKVGYSGDFCMRMSMSMLPLLALIVMDTLVTAKRTGKRAIVIAIIVTLTLGALTPLSEIVHTVRFTPWGETYEMPYVREEQIFTEPNFNGPVAESRFFRWLARGPRP